MSRAASATHYLPDVGRWRGHGLRTDRAANLVQLRGVRYRESCRPRQSLRGNGCGPRTELQTRFKTSTGPRYGEAFVMSAGFRAPAIQMSDSEEAPRRCLTSLAAISLLRREVVPRRRNLLAR